MKFLFTTIAILGSFTFSLGQDYESTDRYIFLKKMPYLKNYYKAPFDCKNRIDETSTTMHDRICANLSLQESDSTYCALRDELKTYYKETNQDSALLSFNAATKSWLNFREHHCDTICSCSKNCLGCNLCLTFCMDCTTEVTNAKVAELQLLLKAIKPEDE